MEKKGTKIAYFIALAIVVIALVIAKVTNDGSGFVATGWALFPPVVAIALALISKEVYSSLFLGCLAGALLLANFDPWQMVVNFVGAGEGVGMINAIDISILIFLVAPSWAIPPRVPSCFGSMQQGRIMLRCAKPLKRWDASKSL